MTITVEIALELVTAIRTPSTKHDRKRNATAKNNMLFRQTPEKMSTDGYAII